MAAYGDARVSTDGQSLAAQIAELKPPNARFFKRRSVSTDRKQLMRLITALAKGDILVVTRLDRLARSTRDLLNLWGRSPRKERVQIAERHLGDTTTAHGRFMLTVLGGLAEFERELIRTRTGEGRERAKARGIILGRKPKLTGHRAGSQRVAERRERC